MRAFLFKCLRNILLPMTDAHFYAEFLMNMFSQVLGRIDTSMLTTRAAKREHQRRKATLDITTHMGIGQFVDTVKEGQNFAVILQETDDRLIQSRQLLIRIITSGVMRTTAIEHIPSPIT